MPKKDTIMVVCAHNDDAIIGVGGTLARYKNEGKRIVAVIFSYGTSLHRHMKEEVIENIREREEKRMKRLLGIDKYINFDMREGKFKEEIISKEIFKKISGIIKEERPVKIFTHSLDDPHRDHRALYRMIKTMIYHGKIDCDVYSFNVWNIFTLRGRQKPRLVVDITETFKAKLKVMRLHKSSSKAARILLTLKVYVHAVINGWYKQAKYAEVFYKIH